MVEGLIVSFETRVLQDVCLVLQAAERRLGSVHAQALFAMIADVEAFDECGQVIAFVGEGAEVAEDDSLCLPIGARYRLRFVVAGTRFQRDALGRVIWSSVTRLKLMDVEDVE